MKNKVTLFISALVSLIPLIINAGSRNLVPEIIGDNGSSSSSFRIRVQSGIIGRNSGAASSADARQERDSRASRNTAAASSADSEQSGAMSDHEKSKILEKIFQAIKQGNKNKAIKTIKHNTWILTGHITSSSVKFDTSMSIRWFYQLLFEKDSTLSISEKLDIFKCIIEEGKNNALFIEQLETWWQAKEANKELDRKLQRIILDKILIFSDNTPLAKLPLGSSGSNSPRSWIINEDYQDGDFNDENELLSDPFADHPSASVRRTHPVDLTVPASGSSEAADRHIIAPGVHPVLSNPHPIVPNPHVVRGIAPLPGASVNPPISSVPSVSPTPAVITSPAITPPAIATPSVMPSKPGPLKPGSGAQMNQSKGFTSRLSTFFSKYKLMCSLSAGCIVLGGLWLVLKKKSIQSLPKQAAMPQNIPTVAPTPLLLS